MLDTRYLMKRRQTWYVKVKVPLALQARLGTHIVKTLQTRSLLEAQLKRHSAVASIKAELEALRTGAPVEAMKEALRWRVFRRNDESYITGRRH
jgi:hypothetical protein